MLKDLPAAGGESEGSSDLVAKPIEVPEEVKEPKTNGILGNLEKAFWPLTDLILQLFESYMKNMYGKSLPCRLESITPLKGECTDLKQA